MTTMPMQFAPPPRHVPLSLRVVNMFNGAAQLGWGVFGFVEATCTTDFVSSASTTTIAIR